MKIGTFLTSIVLLKKTFIMNIAISGLSGFIGSALGSFLGALGHLIINLDRNMINDEARLQSAISFSDVVINLAGSPLNKRWNRRNRAEIYDSRILTTRKIVDAINACSNKPKTFISVSATGIYSDLEINDELTATNKNDFLSHLCKDWESEASKVDSSVRLVIMRLGIVVGADGGLYQKIFDIPKKRIGIFYGDGCQIVSWIHLDDLIQIVNIIINKNDIRGIVNCVAPKPTNMYNFVKHVGECTKVLHAVRIPAYLLRLRSEERRVGKEC